MYGQNYVFRFEYEQPTGLYLILAFAFAYFLAIIINACAKKT